MCPPLLNEGIVGDRKMDDLPPNECALAEAVSSIALHEHLCLIYETQEQQFAAALPFLKIGLERGEKCLYIADANNTATLVNATRAHGLDVDAAIRQGSLTITNREIYQSQDNFDPDRLRRLYPEEPVLRAPRGVSPAPPE